MEEIIQVKEQFYILATSSRTDDRTRVLKHGESFGVFDRGGSIRPVGLGEMGLFHEGTRFLSALQWLKTVERKPSIFPKRMSMTNSWPALRDVGLIVVSMPSAVKRLGTDPRTPC